MISIVQYGSDTCQPCGALETKLGAWVKEQEGIEYSYVSVELEPAKAAQQGVFTVPAIVLCIWMARKLHVAPVISASMSC